MPDRKLTLADVLAALPPDQKAKVDAQVADMKALATEAGIAGTCNKCRYWKPYNRNRSLGYDHNIPDDWQECTVQEHIGAKVMSVVCWDEGEGLQVTLTAPDYGCLQSRLPDKPTKEVT